MALGFVPIRNVSELFQQIRVNAPVELNPLFIYFEQQWLVNIPLEMWNVYEVDIRTNNSCEGWHNRFNRAVNKHHANIWHILRCIKDEQASTEVMRNQMAAGQDLVKERRQYKAIKARIQRIRDRYRAGTIDLMGLVDGISHNLKV